MSSAATERPESSPPARGSSSIGAIDTVFKDVLPARAGIVRRPRRIWRRRRCPPRPRGDRPPVSADQAAADTSSPPARGSSFAGHVRMPQADVLPARAGIVPRFKPSRVYEIRPPRPRGDRPCTPARFRCLRTVLPARAGIVRSSAMTASSASRPPRPRGDRPATGPRVARPRRSSPPARGSSPCQPALGGRTVVLPARAGIVLPLSWTESPQ